jgi:hypothetical protein
MTVKSFLNPAEAKRIILREFDFLQEEYNFKIVDAADKPFISITYQKSPTAIRVGYEPRDRGVFVLLIRLVDGEIPPYPTHIHSSERLNMFYLDDLVTFRAKESEKIGVCDKTPKESVAHAASALRTCAADVLKGDFTVFMELDKIVKSR